MKGENASAAKEEANAVIVRMRSLRPGNGAPKCSMKQTTPRGTKVPAAKAVRMVRRNRVGWRRPQASAAVQRATAKAVQANARFKGAVGFRRSTEIPIATLSKAVSYTHLRAHETPEHL